MRWFGQHCSGISEKYGSTTKFIHHDALGSTKAISSAGGLTDTVEYDSFGKVIARTGTTSTQNGFNGDYGYQEDGESGYKYVGCRYYDADSGRFLTRDPALDGRNWYGYCENNPIRNVDVEGLQLSQKETVSGGAQIIYLFGKFIQSEAGKAPGMLLGLLARSSAIALFVATPSNAGQDYSYQRRKEMETNTYVAPRSGDKRRGRGKQQDKGRFDDPNLEYDTVEEYNEAIREAQRSGNHAKANRLRDAKKKLMRGSRSGNFKKKKKAREMRRPHQGFIGPMPDEDFYKNNPHLADTIQSGNN